MSFVKFKEKINRSTARVEARTEALEETPILGTQTATEAAEEAENEVLEEATEELVAAVDETLPNFDTMSKAEIEIFAREKFGKELDRRQSKNKMIEQLNKIAKGE